MFFFFFYKCAQTPQWITLRNLDLICFIYLCGILCSARRGDDCVDSGSYKDLSRSPWLCPGIKQSWRQVHHTWLLRHTRFRCSLVLPTHRPLATGTCCILPNKTLTFTPVFRAISRFGCTPEARLFKINK